jgi:hypothetical protein
MFNNVSASPTVVKPTVRGNEIDDFEDDTIGNPPSEPFYSYTGDYVVDNRTMPVTGATINMFRSGKSLNLSGQAGNSSEFHFNESDYFSIDFYLAYWVEGGGTLRFKFQNATNTSFEIDYITEFNASLYVNAMDLDDDGHVNCYDEIEMNIHSGETGTPGWIKEDMNIDGVIDADDLSYYLANYVITDRVDVYYVVDMMLGNASYSFDDIIYSFVPEWNISHNEAFMLHSYFQFSLNATNGNIFFLCAFRGEYDEPTSTTWTQPVLGWTFIGACDWDRINITSETDTNAWLDDLRLCYTPYDLAVNSFTPAMDSSIDPSGYLKATLTSSYNIVGSNGQVPMFGEATAYVYTDITGTATITVDIPAFYDGHVYAKNADYTNAITATTGTSYDATSTSMYLGQSYVGGFWYIYRDFLVFDTSILPDDAVIDSVSLALYLKEYTYDTNAPIGGFGWNEIEAFFDNGQVFPHNPIYTFPAPPGETPLSSYDQSGYDDYYESSSVDNQNDLVANTLIDNSRVDVDGNTRCLLRQRIESLNPQNDSLEAEMNLMKLNTSEGSEGPYLRVTYHVPTYSWVPVALFEGSQMFLNNNTISDDITVGYLSDYYWYMNISSDDMGGYGDTVYSWEFPQSGTVVGNKYCYHFQTNAFKEPYVSAWSPAHNAVDVPFDYAPLGGRSLNLSATINSNYGSNGMMTWYVLNNVTHNWVSQGSQSYYDGEIANYTLTGINYDADVYWRVEIADDGSPVGYSEYPNATQSGVYLYGHRGWKFHTEVNTPPYVTSYGPIHGSHFNPFLDTIYINMTDNQTDFTFNLFFLQNVLWGNGTYSDELSFIIEDSELVSSPYTIYNVNGTMNFTWTPSDTANLGYINPMNGTNFSWAVQMDDGVSTSEYPTSGRSFATPSNSEIGDWWVNYTSDWLLGNSLPTISVSYPVHAHTYTATQWKNNHNLHVSVADAEGDDIYLSLSIKSGNGSFSKLFPLQEDYNYFDTMYSDGPIVNGTYDFDLSYFVPFDNMNYSYYLTAEDSAHPRGYWNQLNSDFVIGTPPGATNHLALMSIYPGNRVVDGFSALNNGVTGYFSFYPYSVLDEDKGQVAFIFSDGVQKDSGIFGTGALGIGYKYYPTLSNYPGKLTYLDNFPWNKFAIKMGLQSRHAYILHIGIVTGANDGPGTNLWLLGSDGFSNYQEFTGTFELDTLYDSTVQPTDFRLCLWDMQGTKYVAEPPYRNPLGTGEEGDFFLSGAVVRFSTYPLGSGPNLPGGTWGVNLVRPLSDAGIGFGGLILTLIIVALFTIVPFFFIRKKAKNVPMPIIFSFGFFGFLLSFGLGFLDLWMFVIPFVIMLFIIIFKALAWIRTGKTEAGVK